MPSRKNARATVVGVFDTRDRAEQAMAELKAAHIKDSKIGMVTRDPGGHVQRTGAADESLAEEGAAAGMVAGAGAGALVGAGLLAGVIPPLGPVLALGALGTILVNAAGGAAIASLAGALIGWGIPEEEAEFYEQQVTAGKFLVTVDAGGRAGEARAILDRFQGYDRAGWESQTTIELPAAGADAARRRARQEPTAPQAVGRPEVVVVRRPVREADISTVELPVAPRPARRR